MIVKKKDRSETITACLNEKLRLYRASRKRRIRDEIILVCESLYKEEVKTKAIARSKSND